jgi:hypothetical protein
MSVAVLASVDSFSEVGPTAGSAVVKRASRMVRLPCGVRRGVFESLEEVCVVERLAHDRDGARIDAPLSRSVGNDRRQDDDRDVGGPFIGAKRFKGPIAIHDGHHQIHEDRVRRLSLRGRESADPIVSHDRFVALNLDEELKKPGEHRLVFDDENPRHVVFVGIVGPTSTCLASIESPGPK